MIIVPFLLFFVFFVPTMLMARKVFGNDSLRYAGYVLALFSAFSAALLLSDPLGFFNHAFSFGILPAIMMILFAVTALFSVGVFMFLFFTGIVQRLHGINWGLLHGDAIHHQAQDFHHHVPVAHVQNHLIPQVPVSEGQDVGISEVGRQQIAKLTKAGKPKKKKESKYVYISSEY